MLKGTPQLRTHVCILLSVGCLGGPKPPPLVLRRRPETARPLATSLPALRGEGCFFFVLLSFCTKRLTVRLTGWIAKRLSSSTGCICYPGVKTASVNKSRHRPRRWTRQFDRSRGPGVTISIISFVCVICFTIRFRKWLI
jgi:hypothetical protein